MLTLSTHVPGFTLHTVIWFTLSKHMLGSKFSNFLRRSLFQAYTLHTCFRVHSPYSYLVYTLQAHVRFKIFKFSQEIIISCLHSPHMFQSSLSMQMLHFKILYSYYNFIMCLNAPLNHECLTPQLSVPTIVTVCLGSCFIQLNRSLQKLQHCISCLYGIQPKISW